MKVTYKNRYTKAAFNDLLPGVVFTLKEDSAIPYIVIDELYDGIGHFWNAVDLTTGEAATFHDECPVLVIPAELILG